MGNISPTVNTHVTVLTDTHTQITVLMASQPAPTNVCVCFCSTVQDPERAAVVPPGSEPLQPAAGGAGGTHEDEETHPGHQRATGAGGLPG